MTLRSSPYNGEMVLFYQDFGRIITISGGMSHVVPQHLSNLGRIAASVHAGVGALAVLSDAKDANRCRHSMAQLRSLDPRAALAAAKAYKTARGYVLLQLPVSAIVRKSGVLQHRRMCCWSLLLS